MSSHCVGPNCGAEMEWVETVNGRPLPLDIGSFEDGNVEITAEGKARILAPTEKQPGQLYRRAHFATCPDRKNFKKGHR